MHPTLSSSLLPFDKGTAQQLSICYDCFCWPELITAPSCPEELDRQGSWGWGGRGGRQRRQTVCVHVHMCFLAPWAHNKLKKHDVVNRCTMVLGMLSWTVATIQDYRSGLQKKKTATSPETSENDCKTYVYDHVFWMLSMLAWSITGLIRIQHNVYILLGLQQNTHRGA